MDQEIRHVTYYLYFIIAKGDVCFLLCLSFLLLLYKYSIHTHTLMLNYYLYAVTTCIEKLEEGCQDLLLDII